MDVEVVVGDEAPHGNPHLEQVKGETEEPPNLVWEGGGGAGLEELTRLYRSDYLVVLLVVISIGLIRGYVPTFERHLPNDFAMVNYPFTSNEMVCFGVRSLW